ncbi:MAG: YabP/YqfC family sporulation protein [Clostridia bacterium]|nr:YabP/YqfC family sporulation protein [Clostridia bacterium]
MININIVDRLVQSMEVPEAVSTVSKVTVISDFSVLIENHNGVTEYTTEEIRVRLKKKQLEVSGAGLTIEYLTGDGLSIKGKIHSVRFM